MATPDKKEKKMWCYNMLSNGTYSSGILYDGVKFQTIDDERNQYCWI
jgi:hypothetical protein